MSIKVGQIYSTGLLKWAVTHISDYPKYWATLIKNDGVVAGMYYEKDEDVEKQGKLIAEYPTWQEAVNSKEFRGE